MFEGKKKAVTFSFDDGILQDERLIGIFDKYGIKGTFNINSGLLGKVGNVIVGEKTVDHNKCDPKDVKKIYSGHELDVDNGWELMKDICRDLSNRDDIFYGTNREVL